MNSAYAKGDIRMEGMRQKKVTQVQLGYALTTDGIHHERKEQEIRKISSLR